MKNILIILLTSLAWALVIDIFFVPKAQQEDSGVVTVVEEDLIIEEPKESISTQQYEQTSPKNIKKSSETSSKKDKVAAKPDNYYNYAEEIVGKWTPVEGGKHPLEFTKYGCVIQTNGINWRYDYSLDGKKLAIKHDNNARIEITKENNGTAYLELFNSAEFSGKYRRISQPLHIEMTPISSSLYSDKIVGKWQPVDGHEEAIEFTKYGTAIRTEFTLERRYDYSLNGSSLNIKYDKSRIVISEDATYYYLEIYNSREFSGRYRKSK